MRFILTAGQRADRPLAEPLLEGLEAKAVLADKGYDSDELARWIESRGMRAVIPSRKSTKKPRDFDRHQYKNRHLVENLFQKMKVFRRVAFRFEKLDAMFLGFVHLVGALIWLA